MSTSCRVLAYRRVVGVDKKSVDEFLIDGLSLHRHFIYGHLVYRNFIYSHFAIVISSRAIYSVIISSTNLVYLSLLHLNSPYRTQAQPHLQPNLHHANDYSSNTDTMAVEDLSVDEMSCYHCRGAIQWSSTSCLCSWCRDLFAMNKGCLLYSLRRSVFLQSVHC